MRLIKLIAPEENLQARYRDGFWDVDKIDFKNETAVIRRGDKTELVLLQHIEIFVMEPGFNEKRIKLSEV